LYKNRKKTAQKEKQYTKQQQYKNAIQIKYKTKANVKIIQCPSRRDSFKAVPGLDIWKFYLEQCLQNLWFISMKKLAIFGYVVTVSPPPPTGIFLRILNWSAEESKAIVLSNQSLEGR
jgi:hypothetical protein